MYLSKSPLHAVVNHSEVYIDMLLSKGANVNAQDKRGYTPLMLILQRKPSDRDLAYVQKLLDAGTDITIRGSYKIIFILIC